MKTTKNTQWKTAILCTVTMASAMILLSGCAATNRVTRAHSEDRNVTGDDWVQFANEMVTSMLQNGVLDRYAPAGKSVTIAISDFDNQTSRIGLDGQQNIMYNEIKRALVNTQRITVNRELVGIGGKADSLISSLKTLSASEDYDSATTGGLTGRAQAPRLVLYGEIIQQRHFSDADGKETNDFFCNCELIDVETRGAVWSEQFRIKKVTE